jgi:hypothetical protein
MGSLFSDIGGAIGYAASGPQRGRESRAAQDARDQFGNLQTGVDYHNVANPYGDPNNPASQAALGALGDLGAVSHGTGLTPQEASALQAAQLSNAQQQGGAVQAALENAQRSGTLNSGRAVAGELGATQGAANANAQAGAEAAAASAAQRQQAMGQVGQLGQSLTGQELQNAQYNAGQDVAAQEAARNNEARRAAGIQSADATTIGLNQDQAAQLSGLGSHLGDAAGQIGAAAATGGLSGMAGLKGMFGGK